MGYNTKYKGEFKFVPELTTSQLAKVDSFLGECVADHPEWGELNSHYIELDLCDDFSGLMVRNESTGDIAAQLNMIIWAVDITEFGLEGKMLAQGDNIEDQYDIVIVDGRVVKREINKPMGDRLKCPHCGKCFWIRVDDNEES